VPLAVVCEKSKVFNSINDWDLFSRHTVHLSLRLFTSCSYVLSCCISSERHSTDYSVQMVNN
jgi:hypothetical protein